MNIHTEEKLEMNAHLLTRLIGAALTTVLIAFIPTTVRAAIWSAGPDLVLNEKPDSPAVGSTELSNPNGKVPEWSYGYRETSAGVGLMLFAASEHTNAFNGTEAFEGWASPSLTVGVPVILANVSNVPVIPFSGTSGLNPDELLLHPQTEASLRTFAIVRWTAPSAGMFSITANWRDLDSNAGDGFDAHLVLNGLSLFDANVPNGQSTADTRSLLLSLGDQLDFVVGPGAAGNFTNDSTALKVTIVPEPSTILFGLVGIAGIAFRRIRNERKA